MVRNGKKIGIETLLAVCVMIGMTACDANPGLPDELCVSLTPLKIICVEEIEERELLLGQSCSRTGASFVYVHLREISQEMSSCLLEIENTSTGTTSSGWVRADDFVDFAKQEFGSMGLQVIEVQADRVILGFWSGRVIMEEG